MVAASREADDQIVGRHHRQRRAEDAERNLVEAQITAHAGRVPVERRRQVVGHHRIRVHRVNSLSELAGLGQIGLVGKHHGAQAQGGDFELAFPQLSQVAVLHLKLLVDDGLA